jgi:hypothetical protein
MEPGLDKTGLDKTGRMPLTHRQLKLFRTSVDKYH